MDTYQYQPGDGDLSETGDKCPTIWLRYAWEQLAGDGAIGSGYNHEPLRLTCDIWRLL